MGLRGLVATLTVEGAVDTLCFDAYLERVLGPRLRRGDVVVLDNLGAHRASRIEEVAERRGAQVLWLAPYSPDFSPIEQCWSKIKISEILSIRYVDNEAVKHSSIRSREETREKSTFGLPPAESATC
jgi:transposase